MIVLGADTHKRSHTIAAVAAATSELLGEQTVQVGRRGFGVLLRWARELDDERVWALEDCRHVSGSLERFLIERGERVLRCRRTCRRRRVGVPAGAASRIRSTRSTSRAPRCRRVCSPSRPRIWTGPSSTCGCSSTTANALSAIASSSTARCSGTCTTSGPSSCCPAAHCSRRSGARGSVGAWPAPSSRCGSGSRATSCADRASSPPRDQRTRTRHHRARRADRPAAPQRAGVRAADRCQARRRDRRRRALCHRGQARARCRRRADPRQLRQHPTPTARPGRQPPDQCRPSPRHRHPRPLPPTHPRLHRPTPQRRQEHPRSHPLPQALPHPPRLAPAATAPTRRRKRLPTHQLPDIEATEAAATQRADAPCLLGRVAMWRLQPE